MPEVQVLDITGNARQRGEAHGEHMRDEIATGIDRWLDEMNAHQPLNPEAFIKHIQTSTRFAEAVKKRTPDLLDEVRGIATGSRLDFETVFAFQLLDECWWIAAQLAQQGESRESCSSLAVRDVHGAPLAAQTMDLPLHYDGGQLLLRFTDPDTGMRQIIFTVAGLLGLNGLNAGRLAVCVNTLPELPCSREGLPVGFVLRSLVNSPNLASAVVMIETTQHASGQNYVLASPDGIVDIEAGGESVTHYLAESRGEYLYHTNHLLAGPLAENRPAATDETSFAGPSSSRRFAAMTRFFETHPQLDLEGIKALLASADGPICDPRVPGQGFTFGACIMALGTDPSLHITHGPPTISSFIKHGL